jgi:hypothetical protein
MIAVTSLANTPMRLAFLASTPASSAAAARSSGARKYGIRREKIGHLPDGSPRPFRIAWEVKGDKAMKRYQGNDTVEPGLYLNLRQLSFKSVDETAPLPGSPADTYRRVPMLALLLVGPVMGLAFVVFLPFIGFAMVGWLLAAKAARLAGEATRAALRVARPGWEPSLAFFSRSRPAAPAAPERDAWAEATRKKLDRSGRPAA